MPRKTKEQTEKNTSEKEKKVTTKKRTTRATKSIAKKETVKATKKLAEKENAKKIVERVTAKTTAKKTIEKNTAKKAVEKEVEKKANTTLKKASTKKKTSTSKRATKTVEKAIPVVEYYDLPYRYNQTIVKILAQTPTTLFVYWDISDEDRENYKKSYGENFFEETKPVLIIHNNTMNYSFEVEINDFANSWYLHVNDSKCEYNIELGRRPITYIENLDSDYVYISSSNVIESPNNKILFNNDEHKVYFRNIKTNVTSVRSISFIKNMGKIYNIYDLYKTIYKDEVLEDLSSSTFK